MGADAAQIACQQIFQQGFRVCHLPACLRQPPGNPGGDDNRPMLIRVQQIAGIYRHPAYLYRRPCLRHMDISVGNQNFLGKHVETGLLYCGDIADAAVGDHPNTAQRLMYGCLHVPPKGAYREAVQILDDCHCRQVPSLVLAVI